MMARGSEKKGPAAVGIKYGWRAAEIRPGRTGQAKNDQTARRKRETRTAQITNVHDSVHGCRDKPGEIQQPEK